MSAQPQIGYARTRDFSNGQPVEAQSGMVIFAELDGQLFTPSFEVLLVRKNHIIVRERGKKDAKKLEMPKVWPTEGVKLPDVCSMDLHLYQPMGMAAVAAIDAPKKEGPKRTEGPTKMSKCREIWAAHPELHDKAKKPDMCALFIKDAGCTTMGANTYYLTIAKEAKSASPAQA